MKNSNKKKKDDENRKKNDVIIKLMKTIKLNASRSSNRIQ